MKKGSFFFFFIGGKNTTYNVTTPTKPIPMIDARIHITLFPKPQNSE